jgi:hypothetical protein
MRIAAPAANNAAATNLTGFSGSSVISRPAATATRHCTPKASTTPIHTGAGRYRVASTSVATNVLSGSSTGTISATATSAAVSISTGVS